MSKYHLLITVSELGDYQNFRINFKHFPQILIYMVMQNNFQIMNIDDVSRTTFWFKCCSA